MNLNVVHLRDVTPSRWRNGGGVTRELVAWPNAQDWIWRMSVAEIERSGPFSKFEGVQRWFAVLSGGGGVALQMDEHRHELTSHSEAFCFEGEKMVDCQLLGGATQDFNLMLHRDKVRGQMRRVSGGIGVLLNSPKIIAVYALSSDTVVQVNQKSEPLQAHTLCWQSLQTGVTVRVRSGEALWAELELLT